jgi:hypothetical protein
MSLHSIGNSISQSLLQPQVAFGSPARKKTGETNAAAPDAGTIGRIPVGTGNNLLANPLQALEQAVAAQKSAAASSAAGAPATGATRAGSSLNALLQKIQASGAQAPALLGSYVNASV